MGRFGRVIMRIVRRPDGGGAVGRLPLGLRVLGLVISLQLLAGMLALGRPGDVGAFADPARGTAADTPAAPTAGAGASPAPPAPAAPASEGTAAGPAAVQPATAPELPAGSPGPASLPALPAPPALGAPVDVLAAYRGLGAWVDHFDFGAGSSMPPAAILDELARRGVKTLYLQTGLWTRSSDLINPAAMGAFVDLAHQRGMKVVGWYLPGFADLDRDIRRSLAVLEFRSPSGGGFDGFAPDIEDSTAVGGDQGRFNAGIAEYSRRLRASVPAGTVLGAVVPDAKNIERAPGGWAGFPWPEIGRNYDVVLPMAYWSVTKNPASCRTIQMDAASYIRAVVDKTTALMGTERPMHPIGGIADCNTAEEIAGYAAALRDTGSIGGSLYDFVTNNDTPFRDALWGALGTVNALLPAPPRPARRTACAGRPELSGAFRLRPASERSVSHRQLSILDFRRPNRLRSSCVCWPPLQGPGGRGTLLGSSGARAGSGCCQPPQLIHPIDPIRSRSDPASGSSCPSQPVRIRLLLPGAVHRLSRDAATDATAAAPRPSLP